MTMRMLIDARHREETRVAVVKGNRIEEFDFESAEHKQLKGNIYLAKVTRVEPSLQAAFVDYGGNRHGFLAFSEIHPDYYQIPKEDREALLEEEARHAAEEAALREGDMADILESEEGEVVSIEDDDATETIGADMPAEGDDAEADGAGTEAEAEQSGGRRRRQRGRNGNGNGGSNDDAADELRRKRMALRRRYKIQDVIRRRQVLLVQVVKEERGNKGAALTTYLSLAGRYCVLMPNTSHGGGISRKISNAGDRKRLKSIIADLSLPSSMGCIVRTAGLQRTRTEIKRDFDYLARLWDEIREKTLGSTAPALIHDDSDLIKRAIRDIYNRDIEEVLIEGEDGYRAAKNFMKLLMPSHARRVKQYADAVSLFQRHGVEDQLAAMYHPVVQLKSGGYLVINPTEALVSIDINSGRSTREHGIEQTAVATNLEAAREIARQLRLRDMAGLVVIDFIDMEMNSNVRKVEKAMKDALKDDRARIQVGRISSFGLMEMSRQRLRTGVLEASTRECPHCEGTGLVRTASSAGLSALRLLEEEAARGKGSIITLRASQEAAFYVLNNKRREIDEIEQRYGVRISILPDGEVEGARMSVEASGPRPTVAVSYTPVMIEEDDDDIELEADELEEADEAVSDDMASEEGTGRRKRRRRRRRRRDGEGQAQSGEADDMEEPSADGEQADDAEDAADAESEDSAAEREGRKRSRRGRRGGRRRGGARADEADATESDADAALNSEADAEAVEPAAPAEETMAETPAEQPVAEEEPAPKPRRRSRAAKAKTADAETETESVEAAAEEAPAPKPRRTRRKKAETAEAAEAAAPEAVVEGDAEPVEPKKPRRRTRKKEEPAVASDDGGSMPADTDADTGAAGFVILDGVSGSSAPDGPAVAQTDEALSTAEETGASEQAESEEEGQTPRRGWWQRTFGN